MVSILEHLQRGRNLIADGAMGTMLMHLGLAAGECPEMLNLQAPETPKRIARLYSEAGAQIIETNTFGGSKLKLATYGLADQAEQGFAA